jgi:2-methylcitrate dehydratase PrpD
VLATAAITARQLKLTKAQTREAIGIAEYHGPRSKMMRVIDAPTMVKDGSGWGAMAGVSAAY